MSAVPPSRPRLLIVVNVGWFFLSHRLALALAAAPDYEVHIACGVESSAEVEEIVGHGFHFHLLSLERASVMPVDALRVMCELRRIMARVRPEVVQLVSVKAVLLGGLVARAMRVRKVICAFSGLGSTFTARSCRAQIAQRLLLSVYRVALGGKRVVAVFQNEDDRHVFTSSGAIELDRTVIIRGVGVDLAAFPFLPEPPGAPIVLLPARMLRDKGVVEFVEAARSLLAKGVDATFVLAGAPDPANPTSLTDEELRAFCSAPGLEWRGHVTDMLSLLASTHIVCLPSYREGLPKVLLEAASVGRALVATDVPGCREVVIDDENGLLVPARNAPALADALLKLIENPALRAAMGANGRRTVERSFDETDVITSVLRLYDA